MLSPTKRLNRWIEILLAVSVPTSAVAALPMWTTNYGSWGWGTLVIVSALICVAKPFLGLAERIQLYEATITRYRTVESELSEIRSLISQQQTYGDELKARFAVAQRSLLRAQELEPKETQSPKLQEKIYEQVNKELPRDAFFIPT
jgi:biopolymer transport protein ExbB/TolQ